MKYVLKCFSSKYLWSAGGYGGADSVVPGAALQPPPHLPAGLLRDGGDPAVVGPVPGSPLPGDSLYLSPGQARQRLINQTTSMNEVFETSDSS